MNVVYNHLEKETIEVTDEQMAQGCKTIFERMKSVVELSGGASLAASMVPKFKEKYPEFKKVGMILCGGNITPETFSSKLK